MGLKGLNRPAKNEAVFLVKVVIFRQLMMTHCAAEMFWVPGPTNRHHAFLHILHTKITNSN